MAEGQRSLPSTLPVPAPLQNLSATQFVVWIGLPAAALMGLVASLIVVLQSIATQTVDLVLAALLMVGGVIGAQFGVRMGAGLKSEHIRGLLGAILLAASLKFLWDLVIPPAEPYVLSGGFG